MRRHLLMLAVSLLIAACGGDSTPDAPETQSPGPADATTAPETPPSAPPRGTLGQRDEPLGVGDVAPAFEGLPEGRTIVVFYRGHW